MFELNLKRHLTPEERRLLALSDAYCGEEPGQEDVRPGTRGRPA